MGLLTALVAVPHDVRADGPPMLDLAAELGGGGLHGVHPPPADRSDSVVGGAFDARLYARSGHGGLLRVGQAGEMNFIFGGRTRNVDYVDVAYVFRAVPRTPGFHVVPSLIVGPTLMNVYERYEPECLFTCEAPPQDLHALDHFALGGVVGATLDLHYGAFLLGFDAAYRLAFPVEDTPVTRDTMWTAMLRIGGSIALAR